MPFYLCLSLDQLKRLNASMTVTSKQYTKTLANKTTEDFIREKVTYEAMVDIYAYEIHLV